jgi:hypothetical protein
MLTYVMGSPTAWLERRKRHTKPLDAAMDGKRGVCNYFLFVYRDENLLWAGEIEKLIPCRDFDDAVTNFIKDKIK